MESQREEHTEPEVQEEDYVEPSFDPEDDAEVEVQIDEDSDVVFGDDEDFYTDVAPAEEPPASAHRSVTVRLDLLVTLFVGLLLGAALGYVGRPLISPQAQPESEVAAQAAATQPAPTADTAADTDASSASVQQPANQSSEGAASTGQAPSVMDAVIAGTRHFKGDPDAPVTIVEFSDFQCPYCSRFTNNAGKQIDEEYVQTGLVRFGYQHFAFLGPESEWAAQASECAAEQGAFWEYHDLLFGTQGGAFTKEALKQFAEELGLDTAAFDQCLEAEAHMSTIRAERATGQSLGVRGTPAFLVNGRPVVGAQPFEVFQQVIEAEIDGSGE